MNRVIIIGNNENLLEHLHLIDLKEVIAITDINGRDERLLDCIPYVDYSQIAVYQADYYIVFERRNLQVIVKQLSSDGIPRDKIVNWVYYYLIYSRKVRKISVDAYDVLKQCIKEFDINSICDINASIVRHDWTTKNYNLFDNDISINNLVFTQGLNNANYITNYNEIEECCYSDMFLYVDPFLDMDAEAFYKIACRLKNQCEYIAFTIPYELPNSNTEWSLLDWDKIGVCSKQSLYWSKYIVIHVNKRKPQKDTRLYTICHKQMIKKLPIGYHLLNVGDAAKYKLNEGLYDNVGDNISRLNKYINECTAIYWIWKNEQSDTIGISHYRRFFAAGIDAKKINNVLDANFANRMLSRYDLIVANSYDSFPLNKHEEVCTLIDKSVYELTLDKYMLVIEKYYPNYKESFMKVMDGYIFYPFNMFVMRRSRFNQYCEWFFTIVLNVCDKMQYTVLDNNNERVIGYIAERLLTVWIMKNNLKVYEMLVEDY